MQLSTLDYNSEEVDKLIEMAFKAFKETVLKT